MRSFLYRLATVAALFMAASVAPPPASAGPVILDGTTLFVFGTEGEDILQGFTTPTDLSVFSLGPIFDSIPAACSGDANSVTCALSLITQLVIIAGGGDDTIVMDLIAANLPVFISAGSGNDVATGGTGDDIIKGGPGDDVIIDAGGSNQLFGGAGDDVIIGAVADQDGDGPADPRPSAVPVPEPGTALLLGLGLIALGVRRRRN